MTSEAKPRIKITYATLRADNEDMHSGFEEAVANVKAGLGGHHRNYVSGEWRDAQDSFDVRSPIDRDLARADIAMVGDDIRSDVRAAQRAGLRGIFVLSGKHGTADIEIAAKERGGRRPDAVSTDLAAVVAALPLDVD